MIGGNRCDHGEEVSAADQGIYIEKLRRQNVDWADGMWLGFVEWLGW